MLFVGTCVTNKKRDLYITSNTTCLVVKAVFFIHIIFFSFCTCFRLFVNPNVCVTASLSAYESSCFSIYSFSHVCLFISPFVRLFFAPPPFFNTSVFLTFVSLSDYQFFVCLSWVSRLTNSPSGDFVTRSLLNKAKLH